MESIILSVYVTLIFTIILSTVSVIFGLVSWIVLPKWRRFTHYAFINVLLTDAVVLVAAIQIFWPATDKIVEFIILARFLAFAHWLVVILLTFYVEFVNVFVSLDSIRHIYLKANIFGWLLPIGYAVLDMFTPIFNVCGVFICASLFFINVILYLIVLFNLCCKPPVPGSDQDVRTRVVLSTFMFFFTGIVLFCSVMYFIYEVDTAEEYIYGAIGAYIYVLTVLCLNIFFLILKTHRTLWSEYRQRVRHISM